METKSQTHLKVQVTVRETDRELYLNSFQNILVELTHEEKKHTML